MLLGFKLTGGKSVCIGLLLVGTLVFKVFVWLGVELTAGPSEIII
jgi:hypothetical protein